MSTKVEFLRTYFEGNRDHSKDPKDGMKWAEDYISDDFQYLDKDGNAAMDKAAYIGFGYVLISSFENMKFLYSDIREEGESVKVKAHWEGTFARDLDLSAMGLGVIPASGKMIVWPESTSYWKIEGDKVISIQDFSTGGVAEFLAPLGVKLPAA